MARRKKGIPIHGWINVDKPVGIGSTQLVGKIRRALNAQKIGHGGTLDPLASGVLPIALGEATKTVAFIQDAIKTYEFTVTWGGQRTTDDMEGEAILTSDKRPAIDDVTVLLPNFIGNIEQTPPQFSAVKIDGERAYDIARDGDVADIKPREVYIETLEILEHKTNSTLLTCTCGKGTYIRAIARDMGQALGCYGYISALRRTNVGPMDVENAISLEFFEKMLDNPSLEETTDDILLPLQTVLDDIPALALKEEEAVRMRNGNAVTFLAKPDLMRLDDADIDWRGDETVTALATYNDQALAMIEVYGAKLQPVRVFNL